jgi:hypothetical protein
LLSTSQTPVSSYFSLNRFLLLIIRQY